MTRRPRRDVFACWSIASGRAELAELLGTLRDRPLLLLYAAKDEEHNNAAALQEYLEKRRGKAAK